MTKIITLLIFILTATTFAQSVAISSSDGSTADASSYIGCDEVNNEGVLSTTNDFSTKRHTLQIQLRDYRFELL
jgi:hypothetical protein